MWISIRRQRPAVIMAGDLLSHLRSYVQGAGTLHTVVQLDEWWFLYQGISRHQDIDFLDAKIEALSLLADLFASLKRLGLTVVHERFQP